MEPCLPLLSPLSLSSNCSVASSLCQFTCSIEVDAVNLRSIMQGPVPPPSLQSTRNKRDPFEGSHKGAQLGNSGDMWGAKEFEPLPKGHWVSERAIAHKSLANLIASIVGEGAKVCVLWRCESCACH